ncbi:MAG: R3H domain-containing nucleic acid-binding protein [Candidatus Margulisiibacteriota bacterium]
MIFNLFKQQTTDKSDTINITEDMKNDAKSFIEIILEKANFNAVVAINNDSNDVIYLMIDDEYETARIIGKDGHTLQSFQLLTQSYLAKKYNQYVPVFIDCNEYFSFRIEKAQNKARELEEKLSESRTSIELFPMNSLERKAIHSLYTNSDKYTTHSIGQGEDRRIVISLKDA